MGFDIFYAVTDDSGVCGVKSDIYKGIKAVFDNKDDANIYLARAKEKYSEVDFKVHRVSILTEGE